MRGYIAMLAVKQEHRGKGIATKLVRMAIDVMIERDADEVCRSLIENAAWGESHLERLPDCTRDRGHQYRSHETVRTTGFSSK